MSRRLRIEPVSGYAPEIGRWMWAMQSVRQNTVAAAQGLRPDVLDWRGPVGRVNSIGSLLYHIARVEMAWLFADVLEQTWPETLISDFPIAMATDGRMSHVPNRPLSEHLSRLEWSRRFFLGAFRKMSSEDWRQTRHPVGVDYTVTPEWVVFHLIDHEAGHATQIRSLRARAAQGGGRGDPV